MPNYYKPGVWNVICDVCGFEYKSDELRKRWDGLMVCQHDWEPRHPQDLLRVPREDVSVPWTRPVSTELFVSFDIVTEDGTSLATEGGTTITYLP